MPNPRIGRQIKITLPAHIIAAIDDMRGQRPRSEYLRALLIAILDTATIDQTTIDLTDMGD